jgi:hypothetical protein
VSADDEDDEALTWAGGRDPSHYETPEEKAPKLPKSSRRAKSPESGDAADGDESDLPPVTGSAVLVSMGILAGVYLLYTVGWIITVQHAGSLAATPLDHVAVTLKEYLAIAAPALWFAAALYLTRGRRPLVRLVWLVIGALALIPWPFVYGIANVR